MNLHKEAVEKFLELFIWKIRLSKLGIEMEIIEEKRS